MSEETGETTAGDETTAEAPAWDPRPPSQIEAEEGARDGVTPPDPRLRAPDIASAREYAKGGIVGAPGSEADPGGDLPEPYPAAGIRTPSQAEAEGAEPQQVPQVDGAPENYQPPAEGEPAAEGQQ